ncbi:Hypothetical predicted protein [Paramuricea clavata]|uniref:Uncharacterized protein n=1 Tax=Paramuricea clavata TaxID=317549 RepID=A0A7D9EI88_PARCT|nr:Hypothetical predicted protein [Paramuricea clavata]
MQFGGPQKQQKFQIQSTKGSSCSYPRLKCSGPTPHEKLYNKVQRFPPLGRSDHQCVLFTPLNEESQSKATTRSVRNLHPKNITLLGLVLNLENWEDVYEANDVDDKAQCFNKIIGNILGTYTQGTQIRARPKAFTKGDKYEYRKLCAKVANLITNAKRRYYENKASSTRFSNPRKWFECIYSLCGAEKQSSTAIHTMEMEFESTANKLVDAFIAPWANRESNSLAAMVADVEIIDHEPLLPSVRQLHIVQQLVGFNCSVKVTLHNTEHLARTAILQITQQQY